MFTGLIEARVRLTAVRALASGRRLTVAWPEAAGEVAVGASVALNGVCLTVVEASTSELSFEAVGDTLTKTTLGLWAPGRQLNLERACRADARLDGHLVQGHVQATARVVEVEGRGAGRRLTLALPGPDWRRWVVAEGSIAVDGVSLTVAEVGPTWFRLSIIPHTASVTTLGDLGPGQRVNLEADPLARYAEAARTPNLTEARLASWGYR